MSISLDGAHIRTSERKDLACIQARDRRTGRTEIAVCVRVAEVGLEKTSTYIGKPVYVMKFFYS